MHSATLCEVALRRYLETGRFDSHLDFLRRLNRERRELGLRIIDECFPASARVWKPAGGFLLWVELPSDVQIKKVYRSALSQNVAFCHGAAFFTSEEQQFRPCAPIVRAPARNS
jgi:DNA-binding transcriptional MocR family regulator